ncbi:MAG: hypothetical protein M3N49_14670, partial [Candidatus Eremiobacteraeota bacterium]|nr:hypothetical protein [Candidatus Eremiobacteraeota bacterium]
MRRQTRPRPGVYRVTRVLPERDIHPDLHVGYLPLTMIALPFGLGYAIVRHRVVDIGFVVNRATV